MHMPSGGPLSLAGSCWP